MIHVFRIVKNSLAGITCNNLIVFMDFLIDLRPDADLANLADLIAGRSNANPSATPGAAPPPAAPPRPSPEALADRAAKLKANNVAAAPITAVVQPFEDPMPSEGLQNYLQWMQKTNGHVNKISLAGWPPAVRSPGWSGGCSAPARG